MPKKPSFFHSIEYRNWVRCKGAVEMNPTDHNWEITIEWAVKAMLLAQNEYNDIGWNAAKGEYDWYKGYDIREMEPVPEPEPEQVRMF